MSRPRLIVEDVCEHVNLNTSGYCTSCGHFVTSSSNDISTYQGKSQTIKNISKDPSLSSYSEEVIAKANDIYQRISSCNSKNKKKSLIFWCAFQAHIELGLPVSPFLIGIRNHGLTKKETGKALTHYGSYFNTGQKAQVGYVDPMTMIPYYCGHLGISDHVGEMINERFKVLVETNPYIRHELRTPIIAAYIHSILPAYGITINDTDFSEVFTLSTSTITSAKSKLHQMINCKK